MREKKVLRKWFQVTGHFAKRELRIFGIKVLADGILPCIQVYALAGVIESFSEMLKNKTGRAEFILSAAVLIGMIAYNWISGRLIVLTMEKFSAKVRENVYLELNEKCSKIKYYLLEDRNIQDRINKALANTETCMRDILNSVMGISGLVIQMMGFITIIAMRNVYCAIIIVACIIPLVYLSIANGKVTYAADKDIEAEERKCDYYFNVLTSRQYAEERTIFQFQDFIENKWEEQYEIQRKKQIKAFMKYFVKVKLFGVMSTAVILGIIFILSMEVVNGTIETGLFISLTGSMISLVKICTTNLVQYIKSYVKSTEQFIEFQSIYDLEEEDSALSDEEITFQTIAFQNVSFTYPGTDRPILKDLSFLIKAGEKYAIVGENGAGKTTIIKLLTGLYSEYEGKILIDGRELRTIPLEALRKMSAVVFQDFSRYGITVKENIELGNGKVDELSKVLEQVGLQGRIESFKEKENTCLRKLDESSEDLSGGQWQKIAIARALASEAPLRILDEMAASLDAVSELKMYQEYERLSEKNTTIYITHRLSSIKFADNIILLHDGTVAEQGCHEELMVLNGRYATMYDMQRGMYV